jgi:hypothetical protein
MHLAAAASLSRSSLAGLTCKKAPPFCCIGRGKKERPHLAGGVRMEDGMQSVVFEPSSRVATGGGETRRPAARSGMDGFGNVHPRPGGPGDWNGGLWCKVRFGGALCKIARLVLHRRLSLDAPRYPWGRRAILRRLTGGRSVARVGAVPSGEGSSLTILCKSHSS